MGCSSWGCEESDMTERLHFHFSLSCIGEGNGNPLQCSCLENPRDGGAWWAAIYGAAQSRTQLKRLSSSSSSVSLDCVLLACTAISLKFTGQVFPFCALFPIHLHNLLVQRVIQINEGKKAYSLQKEMMLHLSPTLHTHTHHKYHPHSTSSHHIRSSRICEHLSWAAENMRSLPLCDFPKEFLEFHTAP